MIPNLASLVVMVMRYSLGNLEFYKNYRFPAHLVEY